jgi:(p)ppGpp synthase/HD superfamily hydrolase
MDNLTGRTKATEEALDAITAFADRSHGTQMRKYVPDRYIVHPVRVMNLCREYTDDITILAAALLHDVLEDTPVTKEEIKSFLLTVMAPEEADRTVHIVEELTDEYIKSKYPQWNRRKRKDMENARLEKISADAQLIKYADIIDNASEIGRQDKDFARVLLPEYRTVLKKLTNGNTKLYTHAMKTVDDCITQLKALK